MRGRDRTCGGREEGGEDSRIGSGQGRVRGSHGGLHALGGRGSVGRGGGAARYSRGIGSSGRRLGSSGIGGGGGGGGISQSGGVSLGLFQLGRELGRDGRVRDGVHVDDGDGLVELEACRVAGHDGGLAAFEDGDGGCAVLCERSWFLKRMR